MLSASTRPPSQPASQQCVLHSAVSFYNNYSDATRLSLLLITNAINSSASQVAGSCHNRDSRQAVGSYGGIIT